MGKGTEESPVLPDDALHNILLRLDPASLLRAALACRGWCRIAARCVPRTPPLLGYFFYPKPTPPPPPSPFPYLPDTPAVFAPLDSASSSPRIGLAFAPDAGRFSICDVQLGLVLLVPASSPKSVVPRLLVLDPASRRRALLPAPPRATLHRDSWRGNRYFVGAAVLSRAHPSRLCFDAACVTVDGDHPRVWVASVGKDGADDCTWKALPRAMDVAVTFDTWWFERRPVHAAGKVYWHICNSPRLLALDPATMELSFLKVPDEVSDTHCKYRVGELPEDGRLCVAATVEQDVQLWVRGDAPWSDNGWVFDKEVSMRRALDTVPGMPRDMAYRHCVTWVSDLDAGRTGKVFVNTWGYGRFSFHLDTGKYERLEIDNGWEWGHPIHAYSPAWPPAFLATAAQDADDLTRLTLTLSLND